MSELTHKPGKTDELVAAGLAHDRVIVLVGAFGIHGLNEDALALLPFALDLESSGPGEVQVTPDEQTDGRHIDFLFPAGNRPEDNADRAIDRVRQAIGSVGLMNAEPKAVFAGPGPDRSVPAYDAWHEMDEFTDRIYEHEQLDGQLPVVPDFLDPRELF